MAARSNGWQSMLLFLSLVGLTGAAFPYGERQQTCLNAALFPYSNRSNVIFNGQSMPLTIVELQWASARIDALMFKIVSEEMLGVHTIIKSGFGSAVNGYRALACRDPNTKNLAGAKYDYGCCEDVGAMHGHIILETWSGSLPTAASYLDGNCPDKKPLYKGNLGKTGMEPIFVMAHSTVPARQAYHLPLDYYVSYSNPGIDISSFFDNPMNIPVSDLMPCSQSALGTDNLLAADYRKFYGGVDPAGTVSAGTDNNGQALFTMNCGGAGNGYWWLSPKCRQNTSRCIPYFTGGVGWRINEILAKATAWDMPVAATVLASWGKYTTVPKSRRGIFYWWWPDALFTTDQPTKIIFPVSNNVERSQGDFKSALKDVDLEKWAVAGVVNRSNVGLQRPLGTLEKMTLTPQQYQEILDKFMQLGGTNDVMEQLVCWWLNTYENVWYSGATKWLPEETTCEEGQGLMSATGQWVNTRGLAQSCDWCAPGRMSERIVAELTYMCTECPRGSYQDSKGEALCKPCEPGQAAPQIGMDKCNVCAKGMYTSGAGTVNCTSCPAGFSTAFERSASEADCLCPEGQYRDKVDRLACKPCPLGMTCPQGADERDFTSSDTKTIVPMLDTGYWSSVEDPLNIFRCDGVKRCPGNRRPGHACAKGLIQTTQGCAHCEENSIWDGDKCTLCGDSQISLVVFPILPLCLVPIIVCVLYRSSGDGYQRWGMWNNGMLATLFILLNHYQIINIVRMTNLAFPHGVSNTMKVFEYTSDVATMFRPACSGFGNFQSMLLVRSMIPLFLGIIYVLVWTASQVVGRIRNGKYKGLKMEVNRTMNGFFSLIFTFFAAIVEMAFTIFKCTDNPNGTSSLQIDRSITCYEEEWNSVLIIGVVSVVLWVCGFGSLFTRSIIFAPVYFHNKLMQMRWKFLFIRYRADVHWWPLIFVVKGIMLNVGTVVFKIGVEQLVFLCICIALYTSLLSVYWPWRHRPNNGFDAWAHLSLMVAITTAVWYSVIAAVDKQKVDDKLSALLTAFLFTCWLPCMYAVPSLLMSASARAVKQKKKDIQLIIDAYEVVMAADRDEREQFLPTLSDWDFWFVVQSSCIFQMELASRKCRTGYSTKVLSEVTLRLPSSNASRKSASTAMFSGAQKTATAVRF